MQLKVVDTPAVVVDEVFGIPQHSQVIFSGLGNNVIILTDSAVRIWNTVDKKFMSNPKIPTKKQQFAVFTPQQSHVVFTNSQTLTIINLRNVQDDTIVLKCKCGEIILAPDASTLLYSNNSFITKINHSLPFQYQPIVSSKDAQTCKSNYMAKHNPSNTILSVSATSNRSTVICTWSFNPNGTLELIQNLTTTIQVNDIDVIKDQIWVNTEGSQHQHLIHVFKIANITQPAKVINLQHISFELFSNYQVHSFKLRKFVVSFAQQSKIMLFQQQGEFINQLTLPFNEKYLVLHGAYNPIKNLMGFTVQRAGKVELVLTQPVYNCSQLNGTLKNKQVSQTCSCVSADQVWNQVKLGCQKVDGKGCGLHEKMNKFTSQCKLDCLSLQNSYALQPHSIPPECPCISPAYWNANTRTCDDLNCRTNNRSTGRILPDRTCQCNQGYFYDNSNAICSINCTRVQHSTGIYQNQGCLCAQGYAWLQNDLRCKTIPVSPNPLKPTNNRNSEGQPLPSFAITLIVLGVLVLILICIFLCYKVYMRRFHKGDLGTQTDGVSDKHPDFIIQTNQHQQQQMKDFPISDQINSDRNLHHYNKK